MAKQPKKGQNKATGDKKVKNKETGGENNMKTTFHTEGYIKEITVKGTEISIKLDPTEEFSFCEDESSDKKIILREGTKEDKKDKAKFVDKNIEFRIEIGNCERVLFKLMTFTNVVDLLFALKKDRAKLRVSVEEVPTRAITSITIL